MSVGQHKPTPAALSKRDAAEYIGVSYRFIDKLVAAGKLRRCRLGSKPMFRRADLDALLEQSIEQPA
ncbi:MAG: hypothetical protein Aurels2KO_28250 [Aureliella sp.]